MQKTIVLDGGGLLNLIRARELAGLGHRVIIAEPRSFLGRELTATGQAFLQNGSSKHELGVPAGLQKKLYLRRMLDAGVHVLFLHRIISPASDRRGRRGVVLGSKFGLHFLPADEIISDPPVAMTNQIEYVFDVEGVYGLSGSEIFLPVPGLWDNRLSIHYAMRNRTVSLAFRMAVAPEDSPFARSKIESAARSKAYEIMLHLKQNRREFRDARILSLGGEVSFLDEEGRVEIAGRRLPLPFSTDIFDILSAAGDKFMPTGAELPVIFREPVSCGDEPVDALGVQLYPFLPDWEAVELPVLETDTIVAGMGSCGTFAALALKEESVPFIGVETLYDFGGTRTAGMVSGNYHGYRGGASGKIDEEVRTLSERMRPGGGSSQDRTARMLFYSQAMADRSILGGSVICGALTREKRVIGVVVLNEYGMCKIQSPVTIDCTSDADIAVLAGIPVETGDSVSNLTQSFGQWGIEPWEIGDFVEKRFSTDYDLVDNASCGDLLRGIYLAHGDNSDYDFSPLLTPRESRRIVGEHRLTLAEILSGRAFDDVISIGVTPYDTHGRASSDLLRLGLLKFNEDELTARVPLRCAIPKGWDGLLVGGKSTSSTRDANSIYRMNADMENLGYGLGLIASFMRRQGREIRELDMKALRQTLIQIGQLPPYLLKEDAEPSLDQKIKALTHQAETLLPVIVLPGETALPPLAAAFENEPDHLGLACALAWFGDGRGADRLIREIHSLMPRDLTDGRALVSNAGYGMKAITFDGETGPYHRINLYTALLGLCRAPKAEALLIHLCESIPPAEPPVEGEMPYHKSRIDTHGFPFSQRIVAICGAMEHLARRAFLPALESLLEDPKIRAFGRPDSDLGGGKFMCAWLELQIALVTARCAGEAGYDRLVRYLGDSRLILSTLATNYLQELTGRNFGGNAKLWKRWLEENRGRLREVPLIREAYTG